VAILLMIGLKKTLHEIDHSSKTIYAMKIGQFLILLKNLFFFPARE
jgi:hypothetical protein